jgi:hypothetical protein
MTIIFVTCVTYGTHCYTIWYHGTHCYTIWHHGTHKFKKDDKCKNMTIGELNRSNRMWHYVNNCDTSVTPNVFQIIEPSNDGRRHGRGTYLFLEKSRKNVCGCVRVRCGDQPLVSDRLWATVPKKKNRHFAFGCRHLVCSMSIPFFLWLRACCRSTCWLLMLHAAHVLHAVKRRTTE